MTDDQIRQGVWDQRTAQPSARPRVVALPVSLDPKPEAPRPAAVNLPLTPDDFWGPSEAVTEVLGARACHPAGDPNRWDNSGVVWTAAVYQHGACSTTTNLTDDILMPIVSGLWDRFRTNGDVNNPQSIYRYATSVVEQGSFTTFKQGSNIPNNNMRGGFLLAFHFTGDHASVGNEVWGKFKYLFALRNGVLTIEDDDITQISLNSKGVWGWAFENSLAAGLKKDLPSELTAKARGQQLQELPPPATCRTFSECENASAFLAASITADKLTKVGVQNPTNDQLVHLRCSVGSAADCERLGRSPDLASHWSCPLSSFFVPNSTCKFLLPAKRLLVFPDQLELVWFDDFEFDNPAFALYVAGYPGTEKDMCSASLPQEPGSRGYIYRTHAHVGKLGN